jgi:hypothetical protein
MPQELSLNTDQLEQQQRKLARRTGRQLIVEFGSIAKAMAIASHAVQEALPATDSYRHLSDKPTIRPSLTISAVSMHF